jgi:hypothetical protein
LEDALHFIETGTGSVDEVVYLGIKTTYFNEDKVKMLAIGLVATLSESLGGHLLEIRAGAGRQLRYSQIVLLNSWWSAGIKGDDASEGWSWDHADLLNLAH